MPCLHLGDIQCYVRSDHRSSFKNIIFDLYLLTKYIRSISIPSDFKFLNSEVIHYRFGELKKSEFDNELQSTDKRTRFIDKTCTYFLPWHNIYQYSEIPDFLYPIKNIQSNGKSKILKAFDNRINNFCLMKVGTFLGNVEKSNIDSFDRIAWESFVLKDLSNKNYTPNFIDSFILGNDFFLLEEFIDGNNLSTVLADNLIRGKEIDFPIKIFNLVKDLHSSGYKIIDFSLNNFMVDNQENLFIVDLEYLYNEASDYFYMSNYNQGTIGFFFPELKLSPLLADVYALYKTLFF